MTMKLSGKNQLYVLVFCQIKIQLANRISNTSKIKLQRSNRLLLKLKPFLNKQYFLSLYYSYIHSYIQCGCGSTYMTNLKELSSQQKHAMGIICNKLKFEHTKQSFQSNKILKVYKLNNKNITTFMYKVNPKTAPNIFLSRFQKLSHSYPTRFSELNYVQPTCKIKTSNYSISIREPYIWNSFLSSKEKQITNMHKFRTITKLRLPFLEMDLECFQRELFLSIRLYDNLIRLQF